MIGWNSDKKCNLDGREVIILVPKKQLPSVAHFFIPIPMFVAYILPFVAQPFSAQPTHAAFTAKRRGRTNRWER